MIRKHLIRIIVLVAIALALIGAYFIVVANQSERPDGEIPSRVLH